MIKTEKFILIDCDDVLAGFSDMALGVIKDRFNIDIVCDGKNWDLFEYPEVKLIVNELWYYIRNTPGVIRGLKKYDYADELICGLREFGHVICVTAPQNGPYFPSERIKWLIEELGFDEKDIILGSPKHLIWGDVFIDDRPSNVISWAKRWCGIPVIWNSPGWFIDSREPNDPVNILKTGNVRELLSYLKEKL